MTIEVNLKNELLKLLENEEIKSKIKSIISPSNNSFLLEKNNETLKEEIKELNLKIDFLKKEINSKELENSNLKQNSQKLSTQLSSLQNVNQELEIKIDRYKNNCKEILKFYETYNSLSQKTKESLNFVSNSLLEVFLEFIQNIENIYEIVKNYIIENDKDKNYLISLYNIGLEYYLSINPHLNKQNVKDEFDYIKYISVGDGDSIKEVILYGWENSNTDKIVKKSIVKVE